MNEAEIQKIIAKILSNVDGVNSVENSTDMEGFEEYYFTYPYNKYLWSIGRNDKGEYAMFYYPSMDDRSNFLRFPEENFDNSGKIAIAALFKAIQGIFYGFDKVLKDILG